jgi:biotin carboxyl carrier protein
MTMDVSAIQGEGLTVPERVILAPASGRFRPVDGDHEATASPVVVQEQVIGFVEGIGDSTPVRSPFEGLLMGMLAHAGERVREGQPVAWLRLS